ncbi:hypothetical protein PQR36_23130 [Paraburkholderia nemoris]|uniref:hypothetical protein n=1 Tax=Paraburkholderia nemoris TaxID=2793076 RepID=UPI0038B95B7D
MSVQDDRREQELCRLFNLQWDSAHRRDGTDAYFKINVNGEAFQIDVEVKSTTTDSVATARDVGMEHIRKWRSHFWIVGFYSKGRDPNLLKTLCLTPDDMGPWIGTIEEKILPDFALAARASHRLGLADLYAICTKKRFYSIADAKRLHKMQWSAEQYRSAPDAVHNGKPAITPEKMLSILRLRSTYIAQRGATLNNPHVTTTFLRAFEGTDRAVNEDWAQRIREIAKLYIEMNGNHPFKKIERVA